MKQLPMIGRGNHDIWEAPKASTMSRPQSGHEKTMTDLGLLGQLLWTLKGSK
jgi:hypothetical protein